MNTGTSHLTANAAALLGEADKQRVRAIRSRRWLVYPRAKQVLDRLNVLVDHPRGTRMPSIAIYGDSGMGKTMIMKRFRDQHPPSFNSLTGRLTTPVLAMEMISRPGERRFYAELLTLLGAPQRPRADIAQMEQAALRIMEAIGVQVLVIDEVHNILAGTYREQRIVLNTLRFLSNRLQISLVCFGVNDAREAIGGDVQLLPASLGNHAAAVSELSMDPTSFFEANFSAGGSPARFAEVAFKPLAGVIAPLLSAATTMPR